MSVQSLLTASVTIVIPGAATKDAYGGWSDSPTKTSYPASVQVDTSREALEFERQTKKRTFNIYVMATVSSVIGCRVKVAGGPYTDVLIDVLAAQADHAGRGTYWMLRGTEVV